MGNYYTTTGQGFFFPGECLFIDEIKKQTKTKSPHDFNPCRSIILEKGITSKQHGFSASPKKHRLLQKWECRRICWSSPQPGPHGESHLPYPTAPGPSMGSIFLAQAQMSFIKQHSLRDKIILPTRLSISEQIGQDLVYFFWNWSCIVRYFTQRTVPIWSGFQSQWIWFETEIWAQISGKGP